MNLIQVIRTLKQGIPVRDFNVDRRLNALRTVRGVSHVYKVENGKTYIEYRYQQPMIIKVEEVTERLPVISIPPTLAPDPEPICTEIPCDLWLPERKRFTQGCGYIKIADVYSVDGTRYYVLTHVILGGKLYRRPEHVQLQESADTKEAKVA